jgi:peptide/nickel transport system substrate-binding protein
MQNKFGLKDFVLLVVMLAVGITVWLGMVQRDRNWDEVLAMKAKLGDLERQLSRMETSLESGITVNAPAAPSGSVPSGAHAAAPGGTPAGRDESWARPGAKVEWQPAYGFTTDPRNLPDFHPGGEFTEIYEAQPAKVVPSIQTDVYGRRVVDLVMESLGSYDPKTLRLRGQLADAWQVDPAGLWLRAHIRENARFSDGSPVTAEDLRWTFHDFIMNPQIEAQRDRSTLSDTIEKVEALSDRVVEFTFKQVNFLNVDNALGIFVMPKHFYEAFSPADLNKATGLLLGSGPYKLESIDPANQWTPPAPVILVRNEQYWGPKAPLERLRLKAINEELARLTEYKNGDADMITPSAPQFVTLKADKDFAATNQLDSWINMRSGKGGIAWNCGPRNGKLTPMHDPKVRIALTMLLDREKMIRDIWKGMGIVTASFFNPGTPQHDDSLQPWPFDPARGKAFLKEAGWEDTGDGVMRDKDGNPFVFELTYPTGGEIAERLAIFIKDSYAAAGIKCNLRGMDWSVMDPVRDQRDFDALFMGWGANAPESDPKQIFHSDSIKDQGDNFAQWSSPRADAAIDAGRKEMDPEKRSKLWFEFERIMHEEEPWTWIRVQPYTRMIKPEIGNLQMYKKGIEYYELFRASRPLPVKP